MHRRIIADDFGLTHGVNRAILECYKEGVITRASLMVNQRYTQEAIDMIKEHNLEFGLHFNLTQGEALSDGTKLSKEFFATAPLDWIRNELECQLKVIADNGLSISHIDMHHNRNFRRQEVHDLLLEHCDIVRTADNCSRGIDKDPSFMLLINYLFKAKEEEIMIHPGYYDEYLEEVSPNYCQMREGELKLLLDNKEIIRRLL